MRTVRRVSSQIRMEVTGISDEEYMKEVEIRTAPILEPMQKELRRMQDPKVIMTLCSLPGGKGRIFFELAAALENASRLPFGTAERAIKIDDVIAGLERFRNEVESMSVREAFQIERAFWTEGFWEEGVGGHDLGAHAPK